VVSSLKTSEWRIAHGLERFPFKVASRFFDGDRSADSEQLIGARSCYARKEKVLWVTSLEIIQLALFVSREHRRGKTPKTSIDKGGETTWIEVVVCFKL
jgi:hypothetical protein